MNLNLPTGKLIDISLPLDARTFHMRTYSGFKKDMQFEIEVIKEYEDGGYGQIVRGAHMRLHAGTHVDAPSHMLKGAPDLQDVPLRAYKARIDMVHVPYKTATDLLSDLVTGRVEVTFSPTAFVGTLVKDGKLQALAVGAEEPQ